MSQSRSKQLHSAGKDVCTEADPSSVRDCAKESTHWIEIVLLDEAGEPVPNQAYKVVGPGGAVYPGNLDEFGWARIDNLEAGTCKVSFPEIEQIGPIR